MKKLAAVIVLLALVAGLVFVYTSHHSAPENPADKSTATTGSSASATAPTNGPESVPPISPVGAAANPPVGTATPPVSSKPAVNGVATLPPETVLDNARVVMKNYGSRFGENPVGTNAEITEALMGKNPKGVNFITEESGLRVNENGEMVDAWGTPLFFHQVSGTEMEIRSAGQDRKMWTFDDLVTR